ncbi:hypothetical protein MMC26_005402 [Xylographa opegraphella]|nr:hypothetical protein [Xylographa opegraphella]
MSASVTSSDVGISPGNVRLDPLSGKVKVTNSSKHTQQEIPDPGLSVQASLLGSTIHSKATVGSNSSQYSASSRKPRRSEDEKQLLGFSANEIDPNGVSIIPPTSRSRVEAMPIPGGGPRPMNTLVAQHNPQQSTLTVMRNGAGRAVGKFGSLFTSAISGNNVEYAQPREPLSEVLVETRASKRQKIAHKTQTQNLRLVEENESNDDGDDLLGRNSVRVEIPRKPNASTSLTSSTITDRPIVLRQAFDSHEMLEKRMNSDKYARSRGRPPKMAAKLQPRSKETVSIDLTGSDSVPRQPYKGTAQPSGGSGQAHSQSFKRMVNNNTRSDTQSKYFANSSHPQNGDPGLSRSETSPQPLDVYAGIEPHNLSDTFVAMDGKRRNSHSATSSDELAATSPIRDYASVSRLSPQRVPRRASPSQEERAQRRSVSPLAKSADLESSNIKPTKFTDSASKPAKVTKPRKKTRARRVDGYECRAIVIDDFYLESGQYGLGLVFDDKGESLDLHHNGQNLSEKHTSRYIPLLKANRVIWSSGSPVVQLVFSRGEGYPSKVAVKFASERIAAEFLISIQEVPTNFRQVNQNSPHMEKLFDNSIREAENLANVKHNTHKYRDNELELLEQKKQRRDDKGSRTSDTEQANLKRRRKDYKIIGHLQGNKNTVLDPLAMEDPLTTSKHHVPHELLNYSDEDLAISRPQTRIDRILNNTLNTSNSSHATRSKASTGRFFSPPQGISLLSEEFPEELRYSRTHGLGTRWKKALVFPKVGKKKTTVEYDDLERLDDGQFLNDNLLGFYLRYLEYHLELHRPDVAKKVYWFNTYFFASLTQTVRGKRGINYEAVRKWTRNIDVFTYDYAVVPINESAHWYVAIICNLRALDRVPNIEGDDRSDSPRSEKFEALDDFEAEPPEDSSAIPEDEDNKQNKDASNDLQKVEDEDATESFADLQLSEREDKSISEKVKDVHPEGSSSPKGLFKHVFMNDPNHSLLQQPKQHALGAETNNVAVAENLTGPTPASQRKGKRKSIPPPRVFDPEQPAIITLDSLGIAHSPTIRVLKDYLREEAKDKRGGMVFDGLQIKGITVKQIPLQDNFCDCGLFLLGYIEKFVEDPRDFVTKVLQREFDSKRDWPKLNPSVMRVTVRDLVQRLHSQQEDERSEQKREAAAKLGDGIAKMGQETFARLTKDQKLPVNNGAGEDMLSTKDLEPEAAERGDPPPNSRRAALETALSIDEADPLSHRVPMKRKQINDRPEEQHKPSAIPSVITTNAPIVLDSQDSVAQERSPDILAAESAENGPGKLPKEIPESPTRPATRGKPSPDLEFKDTTTSSKRKFEGTEGTRIPKDHRHIISLSDS